MAHPASLSRWPCLCVRAFEGQWRRETRLSSVTMSMVPVVTLGPSWYLGKSTRGSQVSVIPGFFRTKRL